MSKPSLSFPLRILLTAILILSASTAFAADPLLQFQTHLDGAEDVKFFNERGIYQRNSNEVMTIGEGWIILTGTQSIELTISEGAMRIGPNSTVSIDALSADGLTIYLQKGSVRAVSDSSVPITLLSKNKEYSFKSGDYVLLVGADEQFYSNSGSAVATDSKTTAVTEVPDGSGIKAGTVLEAAAEEAAAASAPLELKYYNPAPQPVVSIAVTPAEPAAEPSPTPDVEPVAAPVTDQPAATTASTAPTVTAPAAEPAPEAVPEAETVIAAQPAEDEDIIILVEPEPEVTPTAPAEPAAPAAAAPAAVQPEKLPEPETSVAAAPKKTTTGNVIELIIDTPAKTSTSPETTEPATTQPAGTSTAPAAAPAPEDVTVAVEEETSEPAAAPVTTVAAVEPEAADRTPFSFSLSSGIGFMNKLISSGETGYEPSYISTVLYPEVSFGAIDLGFRLNIAFNGNPLNPSTWYSPRGDNLWNYGGDASGFALIEDITTDALSLFDHLRVGEPDDLVYINADRTSDITFGNGTLLKDLRTSIDAPYLQRAGFYHKMTSPYYEHELLIDDIYHSRLYAARFAVIPLPVSFPISIGLYDIADIQTSPTKILMTPGLELTYPLIREEGRSLELFAEAAGLMAFNFDSGDMAYDAVWNSGIQNILAFGGINGTMGNLSYSLMGAYDRGNLSLNMFGEDYQWRRSEIIALLESEEYNTGGDSNELTLFGDLGYTGDSFGADISYRLPLGSFIPDFTRDRLSISLNAHSDVLAAELGFSSDGLFYNLLGDGIFSLFSTDNRAYASLAYTMGDITLKATYANTAYYADNVAASAVIPTMSLETEIDLFGWGTGTEDTPAADMQVSAPKSSPFSLSAGASIINPAIDLSATDAAYANGPYTSLFLYPGFRSDAFEFQLGIGVVTAGNPFNYEDAYFEAGVNEINDLFTSPITPDLYSLRSTALNVLSFIDYVRVNEESAPFFLRVSDQEPLTLGKGTMLSDLQTAIDYPFIRRNGLYSSVNTKVYDSEFLINDLSNPQLIGTRIGITPIPDLYAFEIGLSGIMDMTFLSSAALATEGMTNAFQMLLVPGADLTFPIISNDSLSLSAYGDFYTTLIFDDAFITDSIDNYLTSAGITADLGWLSIEGSLAYDHGGLGRNLFGRDYSWRRGAVYDFLTSYADAAYDVNNFDALISFGIDTEHVDFTGFVDLLLTESFGMNFSTASNLEAPDLFGFDVAVNVDSLELSLGYAKRGISHDLRTSSFSFFDESSQLYAGLDYTYGDVELFGRFSSVGEYDSYDGTLPDHYLDHGDDLVRDSGTGEANIIPALTIGTVLHLL